MLPNKAGQVVRFHTPFPDEDPKMIFNLLYLDDEDYPIRSAKIRPIFSGLTIPPIKRVQLDDLEVVELDLKDLMMHKVTVVKEDSSEAIGRVVKLHQEKIIPELTVKEGKGVMTTALITVRDFDGQEHTEFLFVTPEK